MASKPSEHSQGSIENATSARFRVAAERANSSVRNTRAAQQLIYPGKVSGDEDLVSTNSTRIKQARTHLWVEGREGEDNRLLAMPAS